MLALIYARSTPWVALMVATVLITLISVLGGAAQSLPAIFQALGNLVGRLFFR
jgi:hypothetical protein